MIDRYEQTKRGRQTPKTATKHPYSAIEHRVIDSAAYRSLTFSARSLLTMLTRQLTKDNNGRLQATYSYLKEYGFAEKTISRGVRDLIRTGLIYRTRCGGYQNGASQYAVTWLPIKQRQGLFTDGFKLCAWRDWEPENDQFSKKTTPSELPPCPGKNVLLHHSSRDKSAGGSGDKDTDNELVPCKAVVYRLVPKRRLDYRRSFSSFTAR